MTAGDAMTPSGPTPRGDVSHTAGPVSSHAASSHTASADAALSDAALSRLRGARVEVDARRAGRVVVALCLVGLAVLVVALFVAGADKNAQIAQLRKHGVAVTVTVTGCLGLLGGSGSNAAGYACRGTFTLDGHRYNESIPGNALRPPGTKVRAVAVPGDPPLLDTHHTVDSEHTSSGVFVVPAILLVVLVMVVGVLVLRGRRARRAGPNEPRVATP
jgi:hypothetical protein